MDNLIQLAEEVGADNIITLANKLKGDWKSLLNFVAAAKQENAYFYLRELESGQTARVKFEGRDLLMFTSNNYLGLANSPFVKEKAIQAINDFGTGCCGSLIVNGNTVLHEKLCREIATFKGKEEAMLFSTGYQMNVGVISTLVEFGDVVIVDKLDHASIIDGCKLSGAEIRAFNHNNMSKLEKILKDVSQFRRKLIIVDGVYSMDGDIANLPVICELAEKYSAMLMVDEAHATGVIGPTGKGVVEHFQVKDKVDIIVGTMSKSLGAVGGFAAASSELINFLKHFSRSYIYSAGLPPSVVATASASLQVIDENFQTLGKKLWQNTELFRTGLKELGFDTLNSVTPIIPISLKGDPVLTTQMAQALEEEGIFISPMLPPAVPTHLSRLRAHVSAQHSKNDIQEALDIFKKVGKKLQII